MTLRNGLFNTLWKKDFLKPFFVWTKKKQSLRMNTKKEPDSYGVPQAIEIQLNSFFT